MICDNCGQDRVQQHMRVHAYFRAGWPPIVFRQVCQGCRQELAWRSVMHRGFYLLSCLALLGTIAAGGYGIVYLVQWLSSQGPAP